jgi:hypothetical protein
VSRPRPPREHRIRAQSSEVADRLADGEVEDRRHAIVLGDRIRHAGILPSPTGTPNAAADVVFAYRILV